MHRGYTKAWRKRWDKGYHQDHLLWVLMDYFIDFAAYRDKEIYKKGVGKINLKRGEWIFTYRELADFMAVNPRRIRTCIQRLSKMQFSTHKATHQYTILKVINYDTYQPKELLTDTHTDTDQTQHRHSIDTPPPITPIIVTKKDKKDKNIVFPDWLDTELWKEYKKYRQNGKGKFTPYAQKLAISKLEKLKEDGNDPNEVIRQTIECGWSGLFPLRKNKDCKEETREEWIARQAARLS